MKLTDYLKIGILIAITVETFIFCTSKIAISNNFLKK